MAMLRCCGGRSLARTPPIIRSPEVIVSSPASMRSKVDLPQPDGPTSTTNSPLLMSRLMCSRILCCPNDFDRSRNSTSVKVTPPGCRR